MNGTPNIALVLATVAEQLRWARGVTRPTPTPIVTTPAQVKVWGPRASRRASDVVVQLPEPRRPVSEPVRDRVLLDA